MNTASNTMPILPLTGNHEFILEDLEPAFPKGQVAQITKDWHAGMDIYFIAKKYKRDPDEIFLALFDQARKGRIKRPFAYKGKEPTKVEKGTKHKVVIEVKKLKKGEPSVIEIDGKRFVYEPETKRK